MTDNHQTTAPTSLAQHITGAAALQDMISQLQITETKADEASLASTEKWLTTLYNDVDAARLAAGAAMDKCEAALQGIKDVRDLWLGHLNKRSQQRDQRLAEIVGK